MFDMSLFLCRARNVLIIYEYIGVRLWNMEEISSDELSCWISTLADIIWLNQMNPLLCDSLRMVSDAMKKACMSNISMHCVSKQKLKEFITKTLKKNVAISKLPDLEDTVKILTPVIKSLIAERDVHRVSMVAFWRIIYFMRNIKVTAQQLQTMKLYSIHYEAKNMSPAIHKSSKNLSKFNGVPRRFEWNVSLFRNDTTVIEKVYIEREGSINLENKRGLNIKYYSCVQEDVLSLQWKLVDKSKHILALPPSYILSKSYIVWTIFNSEDSSDIISKSAYMDNILNSKKQMTYEYDIDQTQRNDWILQIIAVFRS